MARRLCIQHQISYGILAWLLWKQCYRNHDVGSNRIHTTDGRVINRASSYLSVRAQTSADAAKWTLFETTTTTTDNKLIQRLNETWHYNTHYIENTPRGITGHIVVLFDVGQIKKESLKPGFEDCYWRALAFEYCSSVDDLVAVQQIHLRPSWISWNASHSACSG